MSSLAHARSAVWQRVSTPRPSGATTRRIDVLLERKGMILKHKKLYHLYTEEKLGVRRRVVESRRGPLESQLALSVAMAMG